VSENRFPWSKVGRVMRGTRGARRQEAGVSSRLRGAPLISVICEVPGNRLNRSRCSIMKFDEAYPPTRALAREREGRRDATSEYSRKSTIVRARLLVRI